MHKYRYTILLGCLLGILTGCLHAPGSAAAPEPPAEPNTPGETPPSPVSVHPDPIVVAEANDAETVLPALETVALPADATTPAVSEREPCLPPTEPTPPDPRQIRRDTMDRILWEFVDERGFVEYKALRRQRARLKAILRGFAGQDPADYASWPEDDQIAFWLNAYNFHALKIVVDHYPIQGSRWLNIYHGPDSLRHIKGFKTHYRFIIMDEEFTLAGIESRIINKRYGDARLYFALAQQTHSSPPLARHAYRGQRLWESLDAQTGAYLRGEHGVRIERAKSRVWLPTLFSIVGDCLAETHRVDRKFKNLPPRERAILHFVSPHLDSADQQYLQTANYRIDYHRYNWRLNDRSW